MISGDPDEVETRARAYGTMAAALTTAAESVSSLTTAVDADASGSEAVQKLVEQFGDVSSSLDKLHTRYDTAHTNLATYAAALRQAQQDASSAEHAESTAQTHLAHAELKSQEAYQDWLYGPDDTTKDQGKHDYLYVWAPLIEQYQGEITAAQKRQADAEDTVRDAGDTAASNISEVIDHDGLNDKSWYEKAWDATVHGLSDAWNAVAEWASDPENWIAVLANVGLALDIISMFLPPPFNGIGLALGALMQLGSALWKTGLDGWNDPMDWVEVGLAIIPGVAGLVGKFFKQGLRVGELLFKPAGGTLKELSAVARMKSFAGAGKSGMTREAADRCVELAEQFASRLPKLELPVIGALRELSEANAIARISTLGGEVAPSVQATYRVVQGAFATQAVTELADLGQKVADNAQAVIEHSEKTTELSGSKP
ncbi:MAG: hypothetical protein QM635_05180 [Microbacteriaceae bacterium]